MTVLWLVRHGEAENRVRGELGGWLAYSLTSSGRQQAHALAERLTRELSGLDFSLVSSDVPRALETARIVSDRLGLTPTTDPGLRAYHPGELAGFPAAEARRLQASPTEPLADWQPYPGAETWRQFYQRSVQAIEGLTAGSDRPLLAVTHSGVIENVLLWWLGLGPDAGEQLSFFCAPASLTVLTWQAGGPRRIERLNDTAHLQGLGLARPLTTRQGAPTQRSP